jgi:glucose 1-dehydrogenase
MTDKKLAGEIAIVTGSDSGIGQATAVAFAREGADVAVTYLEDQKGADRTVQLIQEAGQQGVLVQLDQSKPQSVEQLFQTVKDKLGTPTVLVNNAATQAASTPVKDMSFETWDHAIKTNLYGPFLCC